MYLTYTEYQQYGGQLTEAGFNRFEPEAEAILNAYTFGRLVNEYSQKSIVKYVVYRLIGIAEKRQYAIDSESISSGSDPEATVVRQENDGVAVTYTKASTEAMLKNLDQEAANIIRTNLMRETNSVGKRLLFRGLYPDE